MVNGAWWRVSLVAAAVAGALIPVPASAIDRWYSAGLYAVLQPRLTSFSNLIPASLLDILLVVVALVWFGLAGRDFLNAPSRTRAATRIAIRTIVGAAALYVLFLALWGLNYRRPRMRDTLPYDASAVTPAAVIAAGRVAAQQLDALHDPAHALGWPPAGAVDADLARGFGRALRETGIERPVVPARPKRTILDRYFRSAGVDGMTDPYFLETLVAGGVLPFERAFVVSHEWSHLAGIADEGEANLTAWRSCLGGSSATAYSGWLFLYNELARAAPAADRAALAAQLAAGPRADLQAIQNRYTRDVNRRVSDAGWRVYDSYLKANRVDAGTASYDEVVRLVLGLRVNGRPFLDAR